MKIIMDLFKKKTPAARIAKSKTAAKAVSTTRTAVKKQVKKGAIKKVSVKKTSAEKVPAKKISAKKAAAKKAVAKKVAKTQKAKSLKMVEVIGIVDVAPENHFFVYEGGVLANLRDLGEALENMSQEQFDFHTVRDGSDFAKWIEGSIGQEALARKIARAKTREACLQVLRKHIG